jgi:A/G-specific adenine glycosylase
MKNWVDKLLRWYDQEKRDLPWRNSSDPYAIWVSEIMLQQTRVETVRDYYQRWMERFPDIKSLAEADSDAVLKLWEGLGYYSRAKNLHKAAQQIYEELGGIFPSAYKQIIDLPGVGPYTAGAIASIAFGLPIPAVDGNVLRVMSRIFALVEINQRDIKKAISDQVALGFPLGRTGDFSQALMELGALVCLPRNPACSSCPLTSDCMAFAQNKQNQWPIVKQKNPVKKIQRQVAVIINGDYILMHQRPAKGLLADLWEFPGVEGSRKKDFAAEFADEYGVRLKIGKHLLDARHVFTHLVWEMKVYEAMLESNDNLDQRTEFRWVNQEELEKLAIPTAFQKIKQAFS